MSLAEHQVSEESLVGAFTGIRQHGGRDQRAPNKPMLLLCALADIQRDAPRLNHFEAVEERLGGLLDEFGRPLKRGKQTVHDPFWRLQGDGDFWEVPESAKILATRTGGRRKTPQPDKDVNKGELIRHHARGGFTAEVHAFLQSRPDVINRLATELLDAQFPRSTHEAILDAVGLQWMAVVDKVRRKRDPAFRTEVMRIYEGRCAVCGYDGRLGNATVGIEAAHIQWHSARGPDIAANGIALCSLHHVAFDRGAFGLDDDRRVVVSQSFVESATGNAPGLVSLHRKPLPQPISGEADAAGATFIGWHRREVFRSPPRG